MSPTSATSGLPVVVSSNVPGTPLSETFLSIVSPQVGSAIGAPASRSFGWETTESDARLCIQNHPFGPHGSVRKLPARAPTLTAASPNWPAPIRGA